MNFSYMRPSCTKNVSELLHTWIVFMHFTKVIIYRTRTGPYYDKMQLGLERASRCLSECRQGPGNITSPCLYVDGMGAQIPSWWLLILATFSSHPSTLSLENSCVNCVATSCFTINVKSHSDQELLLF